ncbi:Uncharacterised protein [Leminorella richardii]|uniref:Uncharacterized protein n=1 Tax=Leminorella richardii TaxID=158841 RepID=A0A2X4UZ54_9GAMM|nr:hypothetical protein [Leminorella richardii]SQI41108.1 Uncharacterised protein [Leminorella richardii]
MKLQLKGVAAAMALFAALYGHNAAAAPDECRVSAAVNANNHLILLSYPYTTPVRRVETFTERDNTGSVFYSIFNYDRCGQVLDMHYQLVKNERRFVLDSEYGLTRMDDGWLNNYSVTMYNTTAAKQQTLTFAREGTTRYRTDASGLITGSIENFIAGSKEKIDRGETRGSYLLDGNQRITNVTLLGTDTGENHFFYHDNGMPLSFISPSTHIIYLYDQQGRQHSSLEIGMSSFYLGSKKTDCIEWNSHNDCTRATSDEIELFPGFAISRKSAFRSTFSYWDKAPQENAKR